MVQRDSKDWCLPAFIYLYIFFQVSLLSLVLLFFWCMFAALYIYTDKHWHMETIKGSNAKFARQFTTNSFPKEVHFFVQQHCWGMTLHSFVCCRVCKLASMTWQLSNQKTVHQRNISQTTWSGVWCLFLNVYHSLIRFELLVNASIAFRARNGCYWMWNALLHFIASCWFKNTHWHIRTIFCWTSQKILYDFLSIPPPMRTVNRLFWTAEHSQRLRWDSSGWWRW